MCVLDTFKFNKKRIKLCSNIFVCQFFIKLKDFLSTGKHCWSGAAKFYNLTLKAIEQWKFCSVPGLCDTEHPFNKKTPKNKNKNNPKNQALHIIKYSMGYLKICPYLQHVFENSKLETLLLILF